MVPEVERRSNEYVVDRLPELADGVEMASLLEALVLLHLLDRLSELVDGVQDAVGNFADVRLRWLRRLRLLMLLRGWPGNKLSLCIRLRLCLCCSLLCKLIIVCKTPVPPSTGKAFPAWVALGL